jgi:hypothetical protein
VATTRQGSEDVGGRLLLKKKNENSSRTQKYWTEECEGCRLNFYSALYKWTSLVYLDDNDEDETEGVRAGAGSDLR